MVQVPWKANLKPGAGYDTLKGDARQEGVTGQMAPPAQAGEAGDFNLLLVKSTEEFDNALDINVEVGGTAGLFGGSAKFDLKKRSKVSNSATFCVLRVVSHHAYQQLERPMLTEEAKHLLRTKQTVRFRERFGDRFVSGMVSGVEFFGVVRIEASSEQRQLDVASRIQANYALVASGKAGVDVKEVSSSSEQRIEIFTYQRGGQVSVCQSVEDLFKLAQKALDDGRKGLGYPFAVELDDYKELNLPDDAASPIDIAFARATLRKLAAHAEALDRMANDIDFVLRNPAWFDGVDTAKLNAANKAIAAELNTLRDRAETCATDADKCEAYAPTYPEFVMPNRKAGAPADPPPAPAAPPIPKGQGAIDPRFIKNILLNPQDAMEMKTPKRWPKP